jgi:hypothetical protein
MMRRFSLADDGECSVFEVVPSFSLSVDSSLIHGWLCFDKPGERRRLAPIPKNWEGLSEQDLSKLWERAKRAARVEFNWDSRLFDAANKSRW